MGIQLASIPGAIAVICAICSIVLLLTGWRGLLLPEVSSFMVILGIGVWIWVTGLQLHIGGAIWDMGWLLLCSIASIMFVKHLWRSSAWSDHVTLVGHMLIIAASWTIVDLMRAAETGTSWVDNFTPIMMSLIVGTVIGFVEPSVSRSFMIVTGTLALKEWLMYVRIKHSTDIVIGALSVADEWWMTFVACRLSASIMLYAQRFVMYMRRE